MPDYRIYLVTEDNHIASEPVGIACDNDLVLSGNLRNFSTATIFSCGRAAAS